MPTQIVDLARFRRQRQGRRPELKLIGLSSSASVVIKAALAALDEADHPKLINQLASGTYRDMLIVLVSRFEIDEQEVSRDVG